MTIGLVGFDATFTDAVKAAFSHELLSLEDTGFDNAAADKGLIDLHSAYPVAPVQDLTLDQLRLLKADFDHYSSRRRLMLNHEEQQVLFLHILTRSADYLNRVDAVVFSNLPHQGSDAILSRLAEIKSLPVRYFFPSIFEGYGYFSKSCNSFFRELETTDNPPLITINNTASQAVHYMTKPQSVPLRKRLRSKLSTFLEFRQYSKGYPVRLFLRLFFSRHFHAAYRSIVWQQEFHPDPASDHLKIYFPLHLQPEVTTSLMGNAYSDQCLAISALVAFLKSQNRAFKIYVKENPKQSLEQRQFLNLLQSDDVFMLDRSVPSSELIENCDIVATISGTAGWEAVKSGKPALIFGTTWYEGAPGVIRFDELLKNKVELSELQVDTKQVERWFRAHLSFLHVGQFDANQRSSFSQFFERSVETVVNVLVEMQEGRG